MTERETEHELLMQCIEEDCYINTRTKIEYPPVALSYGVKIINTKEGVKELPIPLGTYGNLSVVTAPPKTKKTFFISLLASVYMGGSNIYGGDILGHRGDGHLIHFDTEQGKWHCQKVFRRLHDMDSKLDNKYSILYNLHNNDGGTEFKINDKLKFFKSNESEAILFPSKIEHRGIAPKVNPNRFCLNITLEI